MNTEDSWGTIPNFDGASCESIFVEGQNGFKLRVLRWTPENNDAKNLETIIMIPGWNSVPEGWYPILSEWVKKRPLVYIETREKGSCIIEKKLKKDMFEVSSIMSDLAPVIEKLGLEASECYAFGSSLGATILLEAVREEILSFKSMVVLSPNLHFTPPLWARILIPAPVFLYSALVKFVIWYLDRRLNESGQRIRYRRTLLAADVKRLRLTCLVLKKYKMNTNFKLCLTPIGILRASSDTLHDHTDAGLLSQQIPNCELIEIVSNQFAHEADAIPIIESFMTKE
tara:strand:- start:21747 stop:22601 length:855 start_codon:yes stop_codon:yes gene_type:complete